MSEAKEGKPDFPVFFSDEKPTVGVWLRLICPQPDVLADTLRSWVSAHSHGQYDLAIRDLIRGFEWISKRLGGSNAGIAYLQFEPDVALRVLTILKWGNSVPIKEYGLIKKLQNYYMSVMMRVETEMC